MLFIAEIDIMPLKELLDPQGKTIASNLPHIGIEGVQNVRVGKHIRLEINAADQAKAEQIVTQACEKLLANKIMEHYSFRITNG